VVCHLFVDIKKSPLWPACLNCIFICASDYQDKDKEGDLPLQQVSVDDILDAQRREQEAKQDQERLLAKALKERGLHYVPDLSHDDMF
jgi:hypothetical protein